MVHTFPKSRSRKLPFAWVTRQLHQTLEDGPGNLHAKWRPGGRCSQKILLPPRRWQSIRITLETSRFILRPFESGDVTHVCSAKDRGRSSRPLRRGASLERNASRRAQDVQWKMEISCTFFRETSDCSERADLRRISRGSTNFESGEQPKHHNQSAPATTAKSSASKKLRRRAEAGAASRAQNPKQLMLGLL